LVPGILFIFMNVVYMWVIFSRHFKALNDRTYEFNGLMGRMAAPWNSRGLPFSAVMFSLVTTFIVICE
jgi:hypothetical protein